MSDHSLAESTVRGVAAEAACDLYVRCATLEPELALVLTGELDVVNRPRFDALLQLAEWTGRPTTVDLAGVSFADSAGLEPLVESTRRRSASGAAPLRVIRPGRAAGRIFAVLGVGLAPTIDVAAWDAAGRARPGPVGDQPATESGRAARSRACRRPDRLRIPSLG